MSLTWRKRYPSLYQRTVAEMDDAFPLLKPCVKDDKLIFRGKFQLTDQLGVLDSFDIEVELPDDFPDAYPVVRELMGRLPRNIHRHVYDDGGCCLGTEIDFWMNFPMGYTLVEFMNGPVRHFFLGQACVEAGKPWPAGERAHGQKGLMQSLAELIQTQSRQVIFAYLALLSHDQLGHHHTCPCGSDKKIRQCHDGQIRHLKRVLTPKRALQVLIWLAN